MFNTATKIDTVHISYKGTSPAEQGLVAGQIDYMLDPPTCLPFVTAGRLKALAVAAPTRNAELPNVPTLDKLGIKNVYTLTYYGVAAPAGTPKEIVTRLNAEINAILKTDDMRARLAKLAAEPGRGTPEEFGQFMESEMKRYGEIVRISGAKAVIELSRDAGRATMSRPAMAEGAPTPETMFARIWSRHQIVERDDGQVLLYVDRHFIHDVSAVAFAELRRRGLKTRAPVVPFGTPDHYVPTERPRLRVDSQSGKARHGTGAWQRTALPPASLAWPSTILVRASSTSSVRSKATAGPARPSYAQTATRRRTAHSGRSRSASERRK